MIFSKEDNIIMDEAAAREYYKDKRDRRKMFYVVLAIGVSIPPAVTLIVLGLKWVGVL